MQGLRTAGFAEKVTFLTSNTADFCSGAAPKLHEDLVPQFQDVAMEFVSDWVAARYDPAAGDLVGGQRRMEIVGAGAAV